MSAAAPAFPAGIVAARRSTPALVAGLVRDPLSAVPAACAEARMVVTENFGHRRVYLADPDLVQEALVRNADRLAKTRATKQALAPALGEGILTADGSTWRWQRHTIAPAFQPDALSTLLPAMLAAAETTRERWLALPQGSEIDIGGAMLATTYRIIVDTMLSGAHEVEAEQVGHGVSDYLAASPWMFVMALLGAPAWLPFPGKRRALGSAAAMRARVRAGIAARRARRDGPRDLVAMLLAAREPETGRAMNDEAITDNLLTFVLAGHETTAVTLGWTFAALSDHPEVVGRLVTEIETVTAGGPLLPEHVAGLAYVRQVVSEALRLYPPAPLIARQVAKDMSVGGVALPAGSVIFVPIHAIQRRAALWPRPETFDPERFAPEAVRGRHRYAFMPFGAGPRTCVGSAFAMLEAVAILAVLIRALRLERIGPMPAPRMRLTLRPKVPLRMRVTAR